MGIKDAALELAARGIRVFPLVPNGKTPATLHGYQDATTDPKRIEEMWRHRPGGNVAIATGASQLVVVDVDTKHAVDGWDSLTAAMDRLGELPGPTRMASTPNDGAHLFFRAPEGAEIRNSAGKLGPGLDVRARGGYVVAAPSVIDGKHYRWDITEPAKMLPDAWVEALTKPKREPVPPPSFVSKKDAGRARNYSLAALQDEARGLAAMRSGRNDELVRAAARLGGLVHLGGISEDDIRAALVWACSTWPDCDPRKDRGTIERGLEFGLDHPRKWESDSEAA